MKEAFRIMALGATIELLGIKKKTNGSEEAKYITCGEISPEEARSNGTSWMNGVSITGRPEDRIEVLKVLSHKERDASGKETETMSPFFRIEGIQKFSSHHELQVVIGSKTFSISHRKFPTGRIVFEAGEHWKSLSKAEASKKASEEPKEKPAEPLTASPIIPEELKNGRKDNDRQRKSPANTKNSGEKKPKPPKQPRAKVQGQGMSAKEASRLNA